MKVSVFGGPARWDGGGGVSLEGEAAGLRGWLLARWSCPPPPRPDAYEFRRRGDTVAQL